MNQNNLKNSLGIEMTSKEKAALRRLSLSPDFKDIKKVVEKYIQRLNAEYLAGTETEEGSAGKQFYKLRNFLYYWKIILRAIQNESDEKAE